MTPDVLLRIILYSFGFWAMYTIATLRMKRIMDAQSRMIIKLGQMNAEFIDVLNKNDLGHLVKPIAHSHGMNITITKKEDL